MLGVKLKRRAETLITFGSGGLVLAQPPAANPTAPIARALNALRRDSNGGAMFNPP
jgi:hypothetical protein